ncbi:DUF930 domain-containing protein [Devosia psychrophila]|uniref:DUF930 domain-containing protein n=1 Tax=Devosia psychrophila TaxID=728005 RepID=A0A0F5Q1J0_9HYPH|nr:DUF930 domain-containing protein [Devosia psychrophila]KKC34506.1 hypothetical protein WH91_02565 [Devosia psychrophila]SFD39311.1 protein of unknown function [Devosia psychrophila]
MLAEAITTSWETLTEFGIRHRTQHLGTMLSVLGHGVFFGLFLLLPGRTLEAPGVRAVTVDLVSEADFEAATKTTPVVTDAPAAPALQAANGIQTQPRPAPPPLPEQPLPQDATAPPAPKIAPADGMIEATQLLAGDILRDPANRQVRETLPRLDIYERTTQLCNIEALEQLRLDKPGSVPDALVPTAFGETSIVDGLMKAPKGAYRLDRQWLEVSFECSVGADLESVAAFRFKTGPAIPKEEWDGHSLIAEDFDDD